MVTSMKLYERPKGNTPKLKRKTETETKANEGEKNAVKSSFSVNKTSTPNSRRNSMEQPIPIFNSVTDEENEMFLNQATEIDEKFYLEKPKVEIFVKKFNHKDLEDIDASDDEQETYVA